MDSKKLDFFVEACLRYVSEDKIKLLLSKQGVFKRLSAASLQLIFARADFSTKAKLEQMKALVDGLEATSSSSKTVRRDVLAQVLAGDFMKFEISLDDLPDLEKYKDAFDADFIMRVLQKLPRGQSQTDNYL